jgi:predicted permease
MFILNSIAPVFILIGLGKILQVTGFFPDSFFKGLNKLVFWFALPALLISNISDAELHFGTITNMILAFTLASLLSLAIAWIVSKGIKLPSPSAGSFIQGSFRGNGAFIGLPVIIYTLADIDPNAKELGTVILAPLVVLFNILGVIVLTHYGPVKKRPGKYVSDFFIQLFKNPLIAACIIGLTFNLLNWNIPSFLNRGLDALGKAALPLILMSIGSSLSIERLKGAASPSLIASLLKTVITPLIGYLVLLPFNFGTTERMIILFYLGAPAAGMSYVMAEVMGNDGPLAGRIVALSTLISGITLPVIIALGL